MGTDADIIMAVVVVPFAGIAAIKAMDWVYDRQIRGKYYSDYFKNTGKRPKYYNKITGRRRKW